jgi:hypothetical protein
MSTIEQLEERLERAAAEINRLRDVERKLVAASKERDELRNQLNAIIATLDNLWTDGRAAGKSVAERIQDAFTGKIATGRVKSRSR